MRGIKSFLFFLFAVLTSTASFAGEEVRLRNGAQGYLAIPKHADAPAPVLIVIPDWWGLHDGYRRLADDFAKHWFATFVINLYRGELPTHAADAHRLKQKLHPDQVFEDIKAAMVFLEKRSDVNGQRVGVMGWTLGGEYALKFALEDSRVKAVGLHNTPPILEEAMLKELNAPLLAFYDKNRMAVAEEDVRDFRFRLEQLQKRARIFYYPKPTHKKKNEPVGFTRFEDEMFYSEEIWSEILIFFKANL